MNQAEFQWIALDLPRAILAWTETLNSCFLTNHTFFQVHFLMLVASDGLYLICLFLWGYRAPAELYPAIYTTDNHTYFLTTPSGIWAWGLRNSIPYLNLRSQHFRPLSHHGCIWFALWPLNIPNYGGQNNILECETLNSFYGAGSHRVLDWMPPNSKIPFWCLLIN